MEGTEATRFDNVRLREDGRAVVILDQTELPGRTVYRELCTAEDVYRAIRTLQVRGAPAIGICAAYGIACAAKSIREREFDAFFECFRACRMYLESSRPTAVNLSWALRRMEKVLYAHRETPVEELLLLLETEAREIQAEDCRMCRSIAEYGLSLLHDGDGILTHCNAGPLATSRYGTALGPLILGREQGVRFHVFADETRPLLQGARLTAYELEKAGVDVTLICDNMAGMVMKNGWIQACLVGCDRVAANGDTANKIGTSVAAVLAKHYGIPFYVLGPTSTLDMSCASGADIRIEQRDESEIRELYYTQPMAPEGVRCYNPAFDVTDHSLITAIITEQGICRPPYEHSLGAAAEAAAKERGGR